jgi:hypothetical protein
LAAAIRQLAAAPSLPEPGDYEALIPPVRKAWVRTVPGAGLWLFYDLASGGEVKLLAVVRAAPESIE